MCAWEIGQQNQIDTTIFVVSRKLGCTPEKWFSNYTFIQLLSWSYIACDDIVLLFILQCCSRKHKATTIFWIVFTIFILKCNKHIVLLLTLTKKNSLCDLLSWMLPFHENIIKTKPQQFLDVLINAINIFFYIFFTIYKKKMPIPPPRPKFLVQYRTVS